MKWEFPGGPEARTLSAFTAEGQDPGRGTRPGGDPGRGRTSTYSVKVSRAAPCQGCGGDAIELSNRTGKCK